MSMDIEWEHWGKQGMHGVLRGSLIPRDRKIGMDNCKTQYLDSASCYSTPFYASPVLIHT